MVGSRSRCSPTRILLLWPIRNASQPQIHLASACLLDGKPVQPDAGHRAPLRGVRRKRADRRRSLIAENRMTHAACLGECMIELREEADGRLAQAYGGDTLNTAVYMARLGLAVDYVTALGDDAFSDAMLAGWRDEGIGVGLV